MSFEARSRELLQHYQEITSQPCEDPKDQAVRDGLARYDRLHREAGHTRLCAARQVYGQEPCSCTPTTKEDPPA